MDPAALDAILAKPNVETAELTPFIEDVLSGHLDLARPVSFGAGLFASGFADVKWVLWKRATRISWDRAGMFHGEPGLTIRGERDYVFRQGASEFQFVRWNGETIKPGSFATDGGSIPRIAWAVPGLDPWSLLPAFLIHDWHYTQHHCCPDCQVTFEEANDVLMEGVYTLMKSQYALEDWRVAAAISLAVGSFVGRGVWDRAWTRDMCDRSLNI